MNYTKLFYWLTIADNAKNFFTVFTSIFTIISLLSFLIFLIARDGDDASCERDGWAERAKKWVWWATPFCILFWGLNVFTPSKKDALLIIAGGQTLNYLSNDSTAKAIPHELLELVASELRSMAADAKVDLGIQSQKEKLLEEAKKLTSQELIERMKVDTTLAKIILNN